MAVRTVLEFPIDDTAFKRFADMFNQFRQKLGETPAAVGAVNEEIKNSETAYTAVVAAIFAQTESLKHALTAQQDYNKEVGKSATGWGSIAKATKSAVADIIAGTTAILRFASLGGALSGLLGVGSLFGLDKLGNSVSNGRRSAQGVGASIGEQQAFNLSFGRYVDTQGLTGGINAALTDPTKRFALIGLGASQQDIASGDAVKIANDVLPNLKRLADQTPTEFLAPALQARGLGGVFSPEDLRRLKAISPEEFKAAQGQYSEYAKKLSVSDSDARAWQDFVTQLRLAGQEIENILVKGLEPLAVPLKDLSKAFTDVVDAFLKAAKDQGWIDDISSGLEDFAKAVSKPEFKDNVSAFVTDIGALAKAVVNALKWLGIVPDKDTKTSATGPGDTAVTHLPGVDIIHGSRNPFTGKWSGTPASPDSLDKTLDAIRQIESGGDLSAISSKGALGPYQLMPGTASDLGVGNPFDEQQSRAGAKALLQALLREFGGDMDEALAAYNWGAGNLRRDITQHGADWRKFLPRETQAYIIKVENATGGNTIITSSQLPQ